MIRSRKFLLLGEHPGSGIKLQPSIIATITVMKTGKVIISHLLPNGTISEEVIL